jgi:chromosomal replication initiation ATPase DnaA
VTVAEAQMALPLALVPRRFDSPVVAAQSNAEARAWLAGSAAWPQGRLALWGPIGCGKTSLLRDWAAREGATVVAGHALGMPAPPGRLAIDDASAAPERALLHALNAAREAGHLVLLADAAAPARWAVALPDLASRLRATTAVAIGPPEDALLRALLARLLAARQLRVAERMQDWLLARLPRTHAALIEAVAVLDAAGQSSGQPISPPLARRVLPFLAAGEDDSSLDGAPFDEPGAAALHEDTEKGEAAPAVPQEGLL